ncbi:uncharacterized protein LOC113278981 [Papaver somniferum]|uniref:uncharacterized protein LOC113278981 n=1 Tax=Papaver somniferum TaxID=3469 RepID=UPI000E6F99A6|nr:uncharacterized protein LOC113278981 [Papaver somniferum]
MAMVAHFDLELYQMNVKTSFFNGDLDKNIYMEQPKGFASTGQEGELDWKAVKKVLRYLRRTKHFQLVYNKSNELEAECFSDSDFMGSVKLKSTYGYVFMIAKGVIFHVPIMGCPLVKGRPVDHYKWYQRRYFLGMIMDDFSALMSANCELINLRLDYWIEFGNNSPNQNQNLLNLLDLINHAERKIEIHTRKFNQVPTSEETSIEVAEAAEIMKMQDVIGNEEFVEDSIHAELVTDFSLDSSTPSEEEDDDSLELELIPPYFLVESEDVDSLTGRSLPFEEVETPERIDFSKDFITHLDLNVLVEEGYTGDGHKENLMFLHYQEGKPFNPGANFVVDFQNRSAANLEVNNLNSFHMNFKDEHQQFEDLKLIMNNKVNQILSHFICFKGLYFLANVTQVTSVGDVSTSVNDSRMIFDRGRLLEFNKRYYYYKNSFEFSFGVIISCGFELFFAKSYMFLFVKMGENDVGSKLFVLISQRNGPVILLPTWVVGISMSHQVFDKFLFWKKFPRLIS